MNTLSTLDSAALLDEVSALLVQLFDLTPEQVTPEARLYEDLELDSIDAVDMVVHLQKKTGRRVRPEVFKSVRTVQDVVRVVQALLQEAPAAGAA
ncbi:acyl carrier protein [Castellaniella caeni]|uniref:acyl carrier protein n=1 Tax=Castellaniella caeni TaxID=266123 RepID=UPI00082F7151|nr:acyl carrier protein [Castellaniella caeni]